MLFFLSALLILSSFSVANPPGLSMDIEASEWQWKSLQYDLEGSGWHFQSWKYGHDLSILISRFFYNEKYFK